MRQATASALAVGTGTEDGVRHPGEVLADEGGDGATAPGGAALQSAGLGRGEADGDRVGALLLDGQRRPAAAIR